MRAHLLDLRGLLFSSCAVSASIRFSWSSTLWCSLRNSLSTSHSRRAGICGAISYVFARWQRALHSSIKLCLKSFSYLTGDPLRLPHQRVSSPHPYERGFLIQMNAVETRGVRPAVYSSLTVWSSVARAMRKNRHLRRSYISPKEFV
jgi:hypothetical protein